MIIDSFIFFNEFDMLEFRLRLLWDMVDKFIIVESSHTFSGKEKPWNLEDNWSRFEWARNKIVYHKYTPSILWDGSNPPVHTDMGHPCWDMEYGQRGAIAEALEQFRDDDILLVSDCDEMPSLEVFKNIESIVRWEPAVLRQHFFVYNLSYLRNEEWNGTIITTVGTALSQGVQALRFQRNRLPVIENGGWHISYFFDTKGIQEKVRSFSHREYDRPEFTNDEHIEKCVSEGRDLFVRGMKSREVGRDFFPEYFLKQSDNFNWWEKA